MNLLEPKDTCEFVTVNDESAFRTFSANAPSGLAMFAEECGHTKQVAMKSDAGDFAKWLRIKNPEINIALESGAPKLILRSSDIWLPLTFLASDVALPVYLNLVSNYLYDKMKGALKGETCRVHLCAEFEDKTSGKVKRFSFDGDAEALKGVIKRFDLNEFLDE